MKNGTKKPVFGAEGVDTFVTAGKDAMDAAMKAGMDAASQMFGVGKDRADSFAKGIDEASSFSRENVEAMIAASTAAVRGVEQFSSEVMAFNKARMESSMSAAKALMGARTLNELVEAQSAFAKSLMDAYVTEGSKLGELGARLAQETMEPISARMQATVEKVVKPLNV